MLVALVIKMETHFTTARPWVSYIVIVIVIVMITFCQVIVIYITE